MTTAYVLINCRLGKEENVVENLKHVDSVKEVQKTFGAYDVIAKVENARPKQIRDTVAWNISNMVDVRSTLTLTSDPKTQKD